MAVMRGGLVVVRRSTGLHSCLVAIGAFQLPPIPQSTFPGLLSSPRTTSDQWRYAAPTCPTLNRRSRMSSPLRCIVRSGFIVLPRNGPAAALAGDRCGYNRPGCWCSRLVVEGSAEKGWDGRHGAERSRNMGAWGATRQQIKCIKISRLYRTWKLFRCRAVGWKGFRGTVCPKCA